MKRIALAAGLAAAAMLALPAAASASAHKPHATIGTDTTHLRLRPHLPTSTDCYNVWDTLDFDSVWYRGASDTWQVKSTLFTYWCPQSGSWQQIKNQSQLSQCVTYYNSGTEGTDMLVDRPCSSNLTSSNWRSSTVNGHYVIWNQWLQDNFPGVCPGGYAEVVTSQGGGNPLFMSCPDRNGNANTAQQFTFYRV